MIKNKNPKENLPAEGKNQNSQPADIKASDTTDAALKKDEHPSSVDISEPTETQEPIETQEPTETQESTEDQEPTEAKESTDTQAPAKTRGKKSKDPEKVAQNDMTTDEEPLDEEAFDEELDEEELNRMYDESLKHIEEGEVVKGTIIQVMEDHVLIDIGYKSEGRVPLSEFRTPTGEPDIKLGDSVYVLLETTEDANDQIVLSKEKADKIKIWDDLIEIYEKEEPIEGKVIRRIKGGLTVDIGISGFLPGSQIDIKPIRDLDALVGQVLRMKIIKINKKRGNIVLSRRTLLEKEREQKRKVALETIEEGKMVKGIVKNITEYGAFIDLGGIDGLLHVTDMSWGRVRHPSEMFMIGDEVEIIILKFDRENERVSLGLKQKTADPWEKVDEKYVIGNRVRGKIVSLTDYGAFVELEEGVEGLIHVSEMSWTRKIRHPSRVVAIGEIVEVIVLDIDKNNKRISLGMKQTEPNPWLIIENKYQVGSKISGRVRNITDFGAFVELEEGVDGLIHISDLSWTQRIKHPTEVLKKGEKLEAVILSIDTKNERLSLGIKQLQPDPWSKVEGKYPLDTLTKCKVVRITDSGVVAELEVGIDGFIHISELGKDVSASDINKVLSLGDEMMVKVIRVDVESRKIGLSIKGYEESASRAALEEYQKEQGVENINVISGLEKLKTSSSPEEEKLEEASEEKSEEETPQEETSEKKPPEEVPEEELSEEKPPEEDISKEISPKEEPLKEELSEKEDSIEEETPQENTPEEELSEEKSPEEDTPGKKSSKKKAPKKKITKEKLSEENDQKENITEENAPEENGPEEDTSEEEPAEE